MYQVGVSGWAGHRGAACTVLLQCLSLSPSSTSYMFSQQVAHSPGAEHPHSPPWSRCHQELTPTTTFSPHSKNELLLLVCNTEAGVTVSRENWVESSGVIPQGNISNLKSYHTQQLWLLKQVPPVLYDHCGRLGWRSDPSLKKHIKKCSEIFQVVLVIPTELEWNSHPHNPSSTFTAFHIYINHHQKCYTDNKLTWFLGPVADWSSQQCALCPSTWENTTGHVQQVWFELGRHPSIGKFP